MTPITITNKREVPHDIIWMTDDTEFDSAAAAFEKRTKMRPGAWFRLGNLTIFPVGAACPKCGRKSEKNGDLCRVCLLF